MDNTMMEDDCKICANKINVCGVSTMSTCEIQDFVSGLLGDVALPKIEWINDDSCNLVFTLEEAETCVSVLLGNSSSWGSLVARMASSDDVKPKTTSWKDSVYYKKKLEEKGINPQTLKPVGKVILKPNPASSRVTLTPGPCAPTPVSLIPRRLVNQAKVAIYGEEAFSKKKKVIDDDEIARRNARAERFTNKHS